jgi:hydroxymethylpyrimidine pyrophosphatase-like HAD family hydrolase
MALTAELQEDLKGLIETLHFKEAGGVITDLDGTALHEDQGKVFIPKTVELGYKRLLDLGRPFVLNTLRFPQSVLRTFGRAWYRVSNAPIPTVTLNGSLLGYVTQSGDGEMSFEEIAAYSMTHEEIDNTLAVVQKLLDDGLKQILVFYYPRDWRVGEVIWTPLADEVMAVKNKYVSASSMSAVELGKLRDQMHAEEICMIFLLLNIAQEKLMAYQHTRRDNFVTHAGVDKLFGAHRIAEHLKFDLAASIGAGDTEMDRFLAGVGLAVIVGKLPVSYHGLVSTIHLADSSELGELLFEVGDLIAGVN